MVGTVVEKMTVYDTNSTTMGADRPFAATVVEKMLSYDTFSTIIDSSRGRQTWLELMDRARGVAHKWLETAMPFIQMAAEQ